MANSGNIATIVGNVITDSAIDLSTKADLVGGLVPSSQLPSYVDDVLEYATLSGFPVTGEAGKIYVDLATNKIYRWSGTVYVEVSAQVGTTWGGITGTLSNQTDLQTALNAKQASLSGTGFVKSTAGTISYDTNTYITGNQSITVSGDATGSGTTAITLTLASVGTAGTYRSVTTDAKGRVTAGTNPTTISGYGITDFYAQVISGFVTGANSTVLNTDSLEVALEKLQGQVSARLSLSGGTLTGALNGTSATFSGNISTARLLMPNSTYTRALYTDASGFLIFTNEVNSAPQMILNTNGQLTLGNTNQVGLYNFYAGAATFSANVSASNFRVYNGSTTGGYLIPKAGWVGSGTDYSPSIAAETTYGINFFTNGSASVKMFLATTGQLQLNTYTSATSYTGTAAGYLAFDASGNIITTAGVAASDATKLPLAGGTLTGALSGTSATFSSSVVAANYRSNGRIFVTDEASYGDMTSTTGMVSIGYYPAGQEATIRSRNYSTSTNTKLTFDASQFNFSGGNVGIGTTSPGGYKLYIANGTVGNKTVRIDIGYTSASQTFGGLDIFRSASSTVGDGSSVLFSALNASSADTEYAGVNGLIESNTAASENGALAFLVTRLGATRQEKMRLTSIGNLGIGTTSPISGGSDARWITLDGNSYGGGFISSVAGSAKGYLYYDNSTTNFVMQGAASVGIGFLTNNTEKMRITSGGNVGIGVTSPTYNLDVSGMIRATQRVYAQDATNTIEIGTNYIQAYLTSGAAATNLPFYIGTTEALRISSTRNLLIGTTTDNGNRLQVNGSTWTSTLNTVSATWNAITVTGTSGATVPVGIYVNSYPNVSANYFAQYGGNWSSAGTWGMGPGGASDNTIYFRQASSGVLSGTCHINVSGTVTATSSMYSPIYSGAVSGSSYGSIRVDGTTGSYAGIYLASASSTVTGMYDTAGNGGDWDSTTGWHFYWLRSNACLALGGATTASGYRAYTNGAHYVAGSLYATGDVTAYSDVRKKENIVTVDSALEKVVNLRGVYYTRIDDDTHTRQVGVIAQETKEVLPEVVKYSEGTDEYGVAYGNFAGLFIEAFKEQQTQIKIQHFEIAELKDLVKQLLGK